MVHTFNEGEELPNGKTKQWVVTPQDGEPIAIAVICEEWHNGVETLETFVQVTTPANALISRITDRMPAILPRETWATWLGEMDAPLTEVKALLQTFEDGGNWVMTEQTPKRPPRPPKPPKPNPQQDLFKH
jgi:putative SOS response-associated peptidase YedK